MPIGIGIIWGVVWAFGSYKLAMSRGRKGFAPFAVILGFLLGLIGFAIVACVPSTPEAKKLRAGTKAAKVPPDLHEEYNLPIKHSVEERD